MVYALKSDDFVHRSDRPESAFSDRDSAIGGGEVPLVGAS